MKDYNTSYTNLTDASNTAVDNKEIAIDSFEENIDELYKLKVKIINIESKLNGLNNRLSVDTRKIKKANPNRKQDQGAQDEGNRLLGAVFKDRKGRGLSFLLSRKAGRRQTGRGRRERCRICAALPA